MGFEESEAVIFAEKFVVAKIRNEIFRYLSDDDLIVIGIEALGDRKIILCWIEKSGDGEKRTSRSLNDNESLQNQIQHLESVLHTIQTDLMDMKKAVSTIYLGEAASTTKKFIMSVSHDREIIELLCEYCGLSQIGF